MRFVTFLRYSILACALATSVSGATITGLNENFNELTAALGVTSVGAFQTINGTNVDIVGPANGFGALCAAPESGNCIDMDGTGGNPIGQLQTVNEFAAGTYLLSFDLIGNQRTGGTSSVTVTLGNYARTFVLPEFDDINGIVTNQPVTLSSSGNLSFVSNDPSGDEEGELLDNVIVNSASATPEPSSLLLLGSALLGIGVLMRRRA